MGFYSFTLPLLGILVLVGVLIAIQVDQNRKSIERGETDADELPPSGDDWQWPRLWRAP